MRPGFGKRRCLERAVDDGSRQRVRALEESGQSWHRLSLHLHAAKISKRSFNELHLLAKSEPEETQKPLSVLSTGLQRIIVDLDCTVGSAIRKRRMTDQGLTPAGNLHELRKLAEGPVGDAVLKILCYSRILLSDVAESLLCRLAELGAQLCKIAPHADLATMLVQHLEVHDEMRRQLLELEVSDSAGNASLGPHVVGKRFKEALRLRLSLLRSREEAARKIGNRHAVAPDLLRERLEQRLSLLLHHARHEPFGAYGVELVEGVERHRKRQTVPGTAGLEVVVECHRNTRHLHRLREIAVGDA